MRLRGCLLVLVGLVVLWLPAGAAAEEGCPNEAVRQAESAAHPEGFALGLPDCRAYEQVTPVDKNGSNPDGAINEVQAAPSGGGIVFPVMANMPGASSGEVPSFFLASRGVGGWSDQGILMARLPRGVGLVEGWSEDLSVAVNFIREADGSTFGVYLRDSATGASQFAFPLEAGPIVFPAGFSADDSRMIFETTAQLLPSAAAGKDNLYELHAGSVSLVGVLPDGSTPSGGSVAGPYNWDHSDDNQGGAEGAYYTEHTISSDGSRVFFTAGGTEQIYVRENGTRTVPVGTGAFLAATPDGSKVFYLAGGKGGDLVEFDVENEQTTELTPGGGAEGVLGVSDNGSYLYFAANGGSIYVWHDGVVSFVASTDDLENWVPYVFQGEISRASRVTPDGRVLLFVGSDGQLDRYYAGDGRMVCVSCDPGGAPASGPATLRSISPTHSATEPSILLRNLSSGGSRVFFESPDALVPRDTNGVQDVYEWEQQGVGSCQGSSESFSAASGGCLYLVSSGKSPDLSYFADASASGDDVFFYTDQPLVGQDQDGLVDIYDARVGGGLAAQSPPVSVAPCEGEGCRPVAGGAPVFGAPVSATFAGAGNLVAPAPVVVVPKPKLKTKHKVVKPRRKRKRRARKAGRGGRVAGVRGAMRGGK